MLFKNDNNHFGIWSESSGCICKKPVLTPFQLQYGKEARLFDLAKFLVCCSERCLDV